MSSSVELVADFALGLPHFAEGFSRGFRRICSPQFPILTRELTRGQKTERTVGTVAIGVLSPCFDPLIRIVERQEPAAVHAFIAQSAIAALDVPVSVGFLR